MHLKYFLMATATALPILLTGCNDSSDYDFDASADDAQETYESENEIQPRPLFSPADGVIPSATNLLFLGTTDGTLNIPIDPLESEGAQALKATLNELDGFSTTSPITVEFSTTLASDSVVAGDSVRLFEVAFTSDGAVTGVNREVTANEYVATLTGDNLEILVIQPLVPLQELTGYLAVFTSGITDAAGVPAKADTVYRLLKSSEPLTGDLEALEPLRLLTQTYEAAAASQGVVTDDIVLSWLFSTQSITPVLSFLAEVATSGEILTASMDMTTQDINPQLNGFANVHIGTLTIPYYLAAPSDTDPLAPLTTYWTGVDDSALTWLNPLPEETGIETIPVLMTVPNEASEVVGAMPEGGWPVVIFQHGITQDRTNLLAIADTFASAGFAAIAIDMPLHGITDTTLPLHAGQTDFPTDRERTFDLDLVENDTGAAGADGEIDASGQHFINLQSLLTSRDNLRQAVSDLLVLRRSLSAIPSAELNTDQVHFVGHSLGGMTGSVYLGVESEVQAASLGMPGGGIAGLLDGSATFGPIIEAGLAANGVIKGTEDYATFMVVAQTAMDSGDPINFAELAVASHPIHMIEVVGGSGVLPDQVIPNSVDGAPLSGTEPLARVMGLASITTTGASDGIVRFSAGDHSSLLDPTASLDATEEMQSQIGAFLSTAGSTIVISNTDVIAVE